MSFFENNGGRVPTHALPGLGLVCLVLLCGQPVRAADTDSARLYRNRDEQREAGRQHRLTDWLQVSSLAETEWSGEKRSLMASADDDRNQDTSTDLQLVWLAELSDSVQSELVMEYDSSLDTWSSSEASLAFEYRAWELVVGRQDIAFGEYFSHFATGPLIEFGEINDTAISLAYDYQDRYDLALTVYQGRATKNNTHASYDWSLALEAWPVETLALGFSYLSDLADTDERLLDDFDHRYSRKVDAWSAYVLWLGASFEFSMETVAALDSFAELDSDRNRPAAINTELVYFINSSLACTLRIESSRELEDAPQRQVGLAISYRLRDNVAMTLEGLRGRFTSNLSVDEDDRSYTHMDTLAAQLSVAF